MGDGGSGRGCAGVGSVTELEAGDYLLIEAHRRHRVLRTSFDCVWLALHLGGEEK